MGQLGTITTFTLPSLAPHHTPRDTFFLPSHRWHKRENGRTAGSCTKVPWAFSEAQFKLPP